MNCYCFNKTITYIQRGGTIVAVMMIVCDDETKPHPYSFPTTFIIRTYFCSEILSGHFASEQKCVVLDSFHISLCAFLIIIFTKSNESCPFQFYFTFACDDI